MLKPLFKQPRPTRTANKHADGSIKHGMPSGHVFNATALMVWLLCELAGWVAGDVSSPSQARTWAWWAFAILVLMGPVPWARWYNYDHTVGQCAASLVLGSIVGVIAFTIRRQVIEEW